MAENYDWTAAGPNLDTVYATCPACGLVSAGTSASYGLAPDGRLDPATTIDTNCEPGQHRFSITVDQVLPRDVEVTCVRKPAAGRPDGCGRTFLVPSTADSVCCPECHLYQNGPAVIADPQRAQRVADARRGFGEWASTVIGGYGANGPKDLSSEGN